MLNVTTNTFEQSLKINGWESNYINGFLEITFFFAFLIKIEFLSKNVIGGIWGPPYNSTLPILSVESDQ